MFKNLLKIFLAAVSAPLPFRKVFLTLTLLVFGAVLSGCAVGLPVLFVTAHDVGAGDEKLPFVEIQDIKVEKDVDILAIKTAKVTSHILKKDMETLNDSPRSVDKEVNIAVTEGVKQFLVVGDNSSPSSILRVSTFYYDEGYPWGYYYYSGVSKKAISYWQQSDVGKAVNVILTLQQGNTVLLKVRGLWWGNNEDHVAGARQLAREVSSKIIEKLSTAPPQQTVAEKP